MTDNLKYIKLRNREELFAFVEEDKKGYTLFEPLVLFFDPTYGLIAKYWITFSDDRNVFLSDDEILYIGDANEKSVNYYNDFIQKMVEQQEASESASQTNTEGVDLDDMSEDDLNDFLSSAFDVKSTKLH